MAREAYIHGAIDINKPGSTCMSSDLYALFLLLAAVLRFFLAAFARSTDS